MRVPVREFDGSTTYVETARDLTIEDVTIPAPDPGPWDWNDDGVVRLNGFYDNTAGEELISNYAKAWRSAHWPWKMDWDNPGVQQGGWLHATPYMDETSIRALVAPLAPHLEALLGEPAGMHLNLTGWVTTERDWHQDSYLNPPHVGDYYAAVWIALDDINPMSGPFQYVAGSHRWPQVTRELIGRYVNLADPAWPKHSENILSPLFDEEIRRRCVSVRQYVPSFGSTLIWHGRLLHRGSKAAVPGMQRSALIVHFSGINHRQDMPHAVQDEFGGWIFPLGGMQPVR